MTRELGSCLVPIGSRVLYLLPFNLLGNFRDPTQLLKHLVALNVPVVISMFADSREATRVRQAYYLRCGVRELELHTKQDGIVFTGADGFYSQAYTEASFHSLLTECGLEVVRTSANSLARCTMVQPGPTA